MLVAKFPYESLRHSKNAALHIEPIPKRKFLIGISNKAKKLRLAKENIIEIKGMSPFKNTNNTGYTFLTNNENPIKVAYDDRRFCGIECNNNICNDAIYFKNLIDEIESGKI